MGVVLPLYPAQIERAGGPSKCSTGKKLKFERAQGDVHDFLKHTVVVGDEEIAICGLKLVPKHGALQVQGDGLAIPQELRTFNSEARIRIERELSELNHACVPSDEMVRAQVNVEGFSRSLVSVLLAAQRMRAMQTLSGMERHGTCNIERLLEKPSAQTQCTTCRCFANSPYFGLKMYATANMTPSTSTMVEPMFQLST